MRKVSFQINSGINPAFYTESGKNYVFLFFLYVTWIYYKKMIKISFL